MKNDTLKKTTNHLVMLLALIFLTGNMALATTQTDIVGPAGSGQFGSQIAVLPNGNIVVTDPGYDAPGPVADVGAVYLYNGATGALISMITGSTPADRIGDFIVVLSNGNYFFRSLDWNNGAATQAGAITWCSGTSGCTGTVSAANSVVGSTTDDSIGAQGFLTLTNGNFVVRSSGWDDGMTVNAGAVTFCNGTSGCTGAVSSANSLVGGAGFLTALSNGNYVVATSDWDNGAATNAGAVTFCDGTVGCTGTISTANSLVGSTMDDGIGTVRALSNGNYVVRSNGWHNGAVSVGAVTWCSGTSGCTGAVSTSNSLVGSTEGDGSGSVITELANGNYVTSTRFWHNGAAANAGAVTWCSGTSSCTGVISAANSLVGSATNDLVGDQGPDARIVPLSNGNYVVGARRWDNGSIVDAGSATLCSGTAGCAGAISAANSLVGSTADDFVGASIVALSNGNYVVGSGSWDNGLIVDAGAATFCSGTSGCTGPVSAANSLTGSTGDFVSDPRALTNGNYVVLSSWNDGGATPGAGAATFCNGTSGCTGVVSAGNSLVGSTSFDLVGASGVTALDNGNYLVRSRFWNNGGATDAGAVTWCNGTSGCTGPVSPANSLVGSTTDDHIGDSFPSNRVVQLTNGNYVVHSSIWDNGPAAADAGMAAWCNGTSGCTGAISAANALVGTAPDDKVGDGGVTALANGNYAVYSVGRAVTYGAGNAGTTIGPITANNSVITTTSSAASPFALDSVNEQLVVRRSNENIVSLFKPTYTAIVNGNWNDNATWDYGAFTKPQDVLIPNLTTVDLDVIATVNSLVVGCTGELDWNLATSFIVGNMTKEFCSTGSAEFPVGTTANGNQLSLVEIRVQVLNTNPSSLTVRANYGTIAPLNDATTLDRYWTLTERGDLTGDLTFRYQDADVDGNENAYRIIRVSGGTATSFPNDCSGGPCVNPPTNTAGIGDVSTFSNWTMGEPAGPTSAPASISGRITTVDGSPLAGVVMQLSGAISRSSVSDSSGNYRFDTLDTGNFYTVTPSFPNYQFTPANRSFSLVANVTDAVFTAKPDAGEGVNAIDTTEYFVRQHYRDFLNREPDTEGFNFWTNVIDSCGTDAKCIEIKRINVSAAFFLSIEFQETGYLAYRTRKAAFGNLNNAPVPVKLTDFLADTQEIRGGVIVGAGNWQRQLDDNKNAYMLGFVQRADFLTANNYPSGMSASDFVNQLDSRAGNVLSTSERNNLIALLGPTQASVDNPANRAQVLRAIAEDAELKQAEFNKAFVLMQYFGYLRRNPDSQPDTGFEGFNFWLNKLDQFHGDFVRAEMVKAFIQSGEYRHRFGP